MGVTAYPDDFDAFEDVPSNQAELPLHSTNHNSERAAINALQEAVGLAASPNTVPRFASTAARDAQIPSPVAGQMAVVGYSLSMYDGSGWGTFNIAGALRVSDDLWETMRLTKTGGGAGYIGFYEGSARWGWVGFSNSDGLRVVNNLPDGDLLFDAGDSLVFAITAAGHPRFVEVYNGFTTGNAANAYVNSNGYLYRSTSSLKWKSDVEPMEPERARQIVTALEPIWYRSKAIHDDPGHSHYGLAAEQVAEVDPRFVQWGRPDDCDCFGPEPARTIPDPDPESEDGGTIVNPEWEKWDAARSDPAAEHECELVPDGVAYDRLVAPLIAVVREQQNQIDALTARLDALEN